MPAVSAYIASQEEHHRKVSFQEEFLAYLKKNHMEVSERYLELAFLTPLQGCFLGETLPTACAVGFILSPASRAKAPEVACGLSPP